MVISTYSVERAGRRAPVGDQVVVEQAVEVGSRVGCFGDGPRTAQ